MIQREGRYTLSFGSPPVITGFAGVAGDKEEQGPLGKEFDYIFEDTQMGESSWEKAESAIQREAVIRALDKSGLSPSEIDYIFAGDLLNQCIGTSYGIREMQIPFIGLYGACSTMALSLGMAAVATGCGAADAAVAATSSHFCSAERQFRFPLEYAGQRTHTSQWTVTGAGAAVVRQSGDGPQIQKVTFGKIVDLGVKDVNNMGAAMAPAAADTIKTFLTDTGLEPRDFDMILTGDLGTVGSSLMLELLEREDIKILSCHRDCGCMIYDFDEQPEVEAGGSGCGCSGSVLCSHILKRLESGNLKKVLFVATGALMSPTSVQQGESIPCIAHAVLLTCGNGQALNRN